MRIGLVYNPNSGKRENDRGLMKALASKLQGTHLCCTGSTHFHLKEYFDLEVIGSEPILSDYRDTVNAGKVLSETDLVISIGGDGTASDIVAGMRKIGRLVPVVGVALGTSNCGPFIVLRSVSDIHEFDFLNIEPIWVTGLDVFEERYVGSAFNDIVISQTLISTVEGETCTIDASDFFYKNKRTPREPTSIASTASRLEINGEEITPQFQPSQIIISPFSEDMKSLYAYRAVNGLLCWLPYSLCNSAMIVSSRPIITMVEPGETVSADLKQFILTSTDTVRLSGFNAFCVIDGNPRVDLSVSVGIEVVTNARAGLCVQRSDGK
ncbi:diacylglycerol kinase family protein [Mesotoga sp.]|uniref:diacylglycerol kinase family protein n=1 Tax=Mesotoga sp. TaxID=2053577 RepID=UPI001BD3AC46|nr:diacylglycerol kinase family protein [Mesotoga sp.]